MISSWSWSQVIVLVGGGRFIAVLQVEVLHHSPCCRGGGGQQHFHRQHTVYRGAYSCTHRALTPGSFSTVYQV